MPEAERTEGFGGVQPVNGLSERRYAKGEKVVLRSGYWEFWTCVRAFGGGDFVQSAVSPSDYPGHFVRGLAVGDAVPCRGSWEFFCSGAWYGCYEVRRSYDGQREVILWLRHEIAQHRKNNQPTTEQSE